MQFHMPRRAMFFIQSSHFLPYGFISFLRQCNSVYCIFINMHDSILGLFKKFILKLEVKVEVRIFIAFCTARNVWHDLAEYFLFKAVI
jgi:hypothetical protein